MNRFTAVERRQSLIAVEVEVSVDQAGHHREAAAVYHRGTARNRHPRPRSDRRDPAGPDYQHAVNDRRATPAVDDGGARNDHHTGTRGLGDAVHLPDRADHRSLDQREQDRDHPI